MTESQQTRQFLKMWRETYPLGMAIKLNDRSTGGLPDAVLIHAGQHSWVEFKRAGEKLRPLQEATRKRLWQSGARVWVVWFHPRRMVTVDWGQRTAPEKFSWLDAIRMFR